MTTEPKPEPTLGSKVGDAFKAGAGDLVERFGPSLTKIAIVGVALIFGVPALLNALDKISVNISAGQVTDGGMKLLLIAGGIFLLSKFGGKKKKGGSDPDH